MTDPSEGIAPDRDNEGELTETLTASTEEAALIASIANLRTQKKQLTERERELSEQLKTQMVSRHAVTMTDENGSKLVSITEYVRKSVDAKKLAALFPEVSDQVSKESLVRQLRVQ